MSLNDWFVQSELQLNNNIVKRRQRLPSLIPEFDWNVFVDPGFLPGFSTNRIKILRSWWKNANVNIVDYNILQIALFGRKGNLQLRFLREHSE